MISRYHQTKSNKSQKKIFQLFLKTTPQYNSYKVLQQMLFLMTIVRPWRLSRQPIAAFVSRRDRCHDLFHRALASNRECQVLLFCGNGQRSGGMFRLGLLI